MRAKVEIDKSFDESKAFTKEHKAGDFAEFFKEEGEYLDRLVNTLHEHAVNGEGFVVTYTVTVRK